MPREQGRVAALGSCAHVFRSRIQHGACCARVRNSEGGSCTSTSGPPPFSFHRAFSFASTEPVKRETNEATGGRVDGPLRLG
eukprot:5903160-Pyramimonas_sp.AAC.1